MKVMRPSTNILLCKTSYVVLNSITLVLMVVCHYKDILTQALMFDQ